MDQLRLECPRCRGAMEIGVVLDRGEADGLNAPEWMQGEPEKSFWTGLKTKGRERLPVRTYRCQKCGYLESYARVVPKE